MPIRPLAIAALAACGAAALALTTFMPGEPGHAASPVPPPTAKAAQPRGDQAAVLAGGCFWGMEAVFEHVKGVKSVTSGYAGGTKATANYRAVSSEKTDHAEAIRVIYDPAVISYGQLLQVYFAVAHDPTQLNRQHPDVGRSYRSAIFPQNAVQREIASSYIVQLGKSGSFAKPIATKLETGAFYPAESYHQDFARKNPRHPYILRWDKPKVAKLKKAFPALYES